MSGAARAYHCAEALAALSAPPTPEGKLAAADKLAEAVELAMWLHLLDAYRTPAPPPEEEEDSKANGTVWTQEPR